jgi:hypothetical protein
MKSRKMAAATAAALWQAAASIAGILSLLPALQLAVAGSVESSWRHGVELQRAAGFGVMMNFWEAHARNAKAPVH